MADWLDARLDAKRFRDEEPENGLISDAGRPIRRIASSVNTSFGSISAAAEMKADLLIVHHTTWSYIDMSLHEQKLDAIQTAGLSLYCAHASLDCHDAGTGPVLAELLDASVEQRFAPYLGGLAGVVGRVAGDWEAFVQTIAQRLGKPPESHMNADRFGRVGIVPGAGGMTSFLQEAYDLGCDTFLTGEGSMYTRLFAKEVGLNLILAGHDLTESPGVEALAHAAASAFGLPVVAIREPHIG